MAETENKIIQKDKKRMVKALFSYTPINTDEIPLKINDVLEVIEETEEGWWKGSLNGNVGMFPSNFVVELDNVPEELNNQTANELSPTKHLAKSKNVDSQETKHDSIHIPSSRRDKTANLCSSGEDKTDTQKIAELIDKKASLSKKNAVDSTAPRLPPKPVREQARVIYPYDALNEDELSLKEGDIITVISKEVEDKGWWKGELNNKTGVFPDNFVQLIKVEEQKKPERPDKPSTVFTSRASLRSEKSVSEFSPKVDKKVIKTPPAKPPPPEIHKKEIDRPVPPFPVKKPQVPHPMKKPSRSSLGPKFSGFSPPAVITAPKPSATENLLSFSTAAPAMETKPDLSKNAEKPSEKDDKKENQSKKESQGKKENQDLGFEGLESSGKKLIHLTANRAKAPNRRPPSHIFLRETEKENGLSSDPRRLSEPLLSEMKSLLHLGETDLHKVNLAGANETKTVKVPPSRPLPPSIKGNKPAIQGSVILTKTISSEECIVKAPEPIKKAVLPDVSTMKGPEIMPPQKQPILQPQKQPILQPQKQPILQPQKQPIPQPDKLKTEPLSFDKELQEVKESLRNLTSTMVSRSEFNELLKQVRELKESLENCSNNCKKTVSELRNELEIEKKKRKALETELQHIKEHQTT